MKIVHGNYKPCFLCAQLSLTTDFFTGFCRQAKPRLRWRALGLLLVLDCLTPLRAASLTDTIHELSIIEQASWDVRPNTLQSSPGDPPAMRLLKKAAEARLTFQLAESSRAARTCLALTQPATLELRLTQLVCRGYLAGNAFIEGNLEFTAEQAQRLAADSRWIQQRLPRAIRIQAAGLTDKFNAVGLGLPTSKENRNDETAAFLTRLHRALPDYRGMTIRFASQPRPVTLFSSFDRLPTPITNCYPSFSATINGQPTVMRWDTGADTLGISEFAAEKLHLRLIRAPATAVVGADGRLGIGHLVVLREITIGSVTYQNSPAVLISSIPGAVVALVGLSQMLPLGSFTIETRSSGRTTRREKRDASLCTPAGVKGTLLIADHLSSGRRIPLYLSSTLSGTIKRLIVFGRYHHRDIKVGIDTGNFIAVASRRFYTKFAPRLPKTAFGVPQHVTAGVAYPKAIYVKNQQINLGPEAVPIKNLVIYPEYNAPCDLIISATELQTFAKVGFDFANHTLTLAGRVPRGAAKQIPDPPSRIESSWPARGFR